MALELTYLKIFNIPIYSFFFIPLPLSQIPDISPNILPFIMKRKIWRWLDVGVSAYYFVLIRKKALHLSIYMTGLSYRWYMLILIRETSRWVWQKWNTKKTHYIYIYIYIVFLVFHICDTHLEDSLISTPFISRELWILESKFRA